MRVSVVIFSVLLVQTSASFFSELTSSIYSVQSSVGTLISNTAGDIKDTFDCTVFAVRQVFSGDYTTLPGYQKCQTDQNITTLSPSTSVQIIITPLVTLTPTVVPSVSQPDKKEETYLKSSPKSIDVNTKTNDAFEKKQSIESDLLSETRILVNISSKLERDIEDLSKHVNNDTAKTENEPKQPSTENANEIDKLLKEEILYKNNTNSEIKEALAKIITKLRIDNNSTNMFGLKEEIKLALDKLEYNNNQTNLEQEFKVWKEEELNILNYIRNWLKQDKENETKTPGQTLTNMINTTEPIEKDMNEIEKLLKEEIKYKNNTNSDINEAFAKIITKLQIDTNNTNMFDLKKEIKLALEKLEHNNNQTNLEQEFKAWKEEELNILNDIRNWLEQDKQNDTITPGQTSTKSNTTESIKNVMNEIDKLLKEEMKYKNNTNSEINETLAKIITKLRMDTNNTNIMFDLKNEIKLALEKLEYNNNQRNLEQEFKVWKKEELKSLNDIRNWLKKDKQNDTITPGQTFTKSNTTEPIENVMNEIDKLLIEEMKYKNNTNSEINEALAKIITKLRMDKNNTNMFDLKNEIKLALEKSEYNNNQTNLEQEFKVWKEEELNILNDIRNWLKKDKQNDTIMPGQTLTKMINATKPIIEKSNESVEISRTAKMEKSVTSKETVLSTKETVPSTKRTSTKIRKKSTKTSTIKPSNDYDYLVSNDKSTMDHVLNLVSKSKRTASIMASIHKNRKSNQHLIDLR